jgi:signal transduction histidine kinase
LDLDELDGKTMVLVSVRDNGQTLPAGEPVEMSGLAHLSGRLASRGGGLALQSRMDGGGAVLRYWIPRPSPKPSAAKP